jgi:hypothetical protein
VTHHGEREAAGRHRGDPASPGSIGAQARVAALACLLPVAVFVLCRTLSAAWYRGDLSGMPDEGQVPIGVLPWFLHAYQLGGDVWSDPVRMRTWIVAGAGYVLPGAIGMIASRRLAMAVCTSLVVFGLSAWAALSIPTPPPHSEYVGYFTESSVRSARLWIAALTVVGTVLGLGVRFAGAVVRVATRPRRA